MRGTNAVIQYVQTALFLAVGVACVRAWLRQRDRRWARLAAAIGLLGVANILSLVVLEFYARSERLPPQPLNAALGIALLLSAFTFLLFLHDFVRFPSWVLGAALTVTLGNVVLSVIETPEYLLVGSELVEFPAVENPIPYTAAVVEGFLWLATVFGALWVSFVIYGRRQRGLPRFRMLSIGGGFLLLFVAVIVVPAVAGQFALGEGPTPDTVRVMNLALQVLGLVSAPLLLLGVAPPAGVRRRSEARAISAASK